MNILGISAFYHDSAACLLMDGQIVAAAQEERFTRKKHDPRFPDNALAYCLEAGGITSGDIDGVVFYEKPLLKFDRILKTWLAVAPRGFSTFRTALPIWLRQKFRIRRGIRGGMPGKYRGPLWFVEHHESHASSAFYPSPFEEAAILTMDGVGEWATASIGRGRGSRIELIEEMRFPHSLGLLYTAFTAYCGFRANSGEYKLMGLAPYGKPRFRDVILDRMLTLKDDGSFRLNMDYLSYCSDLSMTTPAFEALLGQPARKNESEITQHYMDVAASIQCVTEKILLMVVDYAHRLVGSRNLVMAGGVALNCVANGRIRDEGPFEGLWIQPAAGDAGGALGAALFAYHQMLDRPRTVAERDHQRGSLLGPSYGPTSTLAVLESVGATFERIPDESIRAKTIASLISTGRVVGCMQGRMEFGPRALGSRSILADARCDQMQSIINHKIKFRESFRPFAPSVLSHRVKDWFEVEEGTASPYMVSIAKVRQRETASSVPPKDGALHIEKRVRSTIPAVTHVDGSARIQAVEPHRHPFLHKVLCCMETATGCPIVINTSFNVRGEPMVCTPIDAWTCFMATDMDALVIDEFVLLKSEQPVVSGRDAITHLSRFERD